MSRILYFGRYIFYRGLMFQRLKIIEYKEIRLILNVLISILIKTALLIQKSTESCFADNDKNTNGDSLKKEIKIIFIKNIQIRAQICKKIL